MGSVESDDDVDSMLSVCPWTLVCIAPKDICMADVEHLSLNVPRPSE